ncbi:DNA circularization protein [Desulfovibrio sp.]|uniref:DNA circularization protein n=1 Tax=Desulfovibrio sp. TaxID=885 RepID=UPI003D0B2E07
MFSRSFFSNLRQASFRGAKFEVDDVEASGGRRLVKHEYPLRDEPYAEDMGRKAREYSVRAYIVQGRSYSYFDARKDMLKALEGSGPGTLIHPWHGEVKVCVDRYSMRESMEHGGLIEVSITFAEAGSLKQPAATADTAYGTNKAATSVRDALKKEFMDKFGPAAKELAAVAETLQTGAALVMEYMGLPQALMAEGLAYAMALIATPSALFGALTGLFGELAGSGGASVDADSSYAFSSAPSRSLAPIDELLITNPVIDTPSTIVLRTTLAGIAVTELAAASAYKDFITSDDALAERDTTLAGIDVIAPAVSDPVYSSLAELRRAVAVDLTTRGGQLPSLRTITLPTTMPALVASYNIYGDADRADEIISRNRVRHPGRVPGQTPLEVLSE